MKKELEAIKINKIQQKINGKVEKTISLPLLVVTSLETKQFFVAENIGIGYQEYVDSLPSGGGGSAVDSVNGKTGEVVLTSNDVNAISNSKEAGYDNYGTEINSNSLAITSIETDLDTSYVSKDPVTGEVVLLGLEVDGVTLLKGQASTTVTPTEVNHLTTKGNVDNLLIPINNQLALMTERIKFEISATGLNLVIPRSDDGSIKTDLLSLLSISDDGVLIQNGVVQPSNIDEDLTYKLSLIGTFSGSGSAKALQIQPSTTLFPQGQTVIRVDSDVTNLTIAGYVGVDIDGVAFSNGLDFKTWAIKEDFTITQYLFTVSHRKYINTAVTKIKSKKDK